MDKFKLDLSKLTPVAEADRVKGNWYVVADGMDELGQICQWHSWNTCIHHNSGDIGSIWNLWFAIPPGLPGFPQELPDEFELKEGEWEYTDKMGDIVVVPKNVTIRRTAPKLLPITIPSGTKSEQVAELKRLLEEFEK